LWLFLLGYKMGYKVKVSWKIEILTIQKGGYYGKIYPTYKSR
jgi:hypothetical protein